MQRRSTVLLSNPDGFFPPIGNSPKIIEAGSIYNKDSQDTRKIIRKKEHWGYIFSVALIFAGAVGNIIDCAFYGLIFDKSTSDHIATLFPAGGGYGSFLYGEVVDMFHCPFWKGTFPDWFPGWGGQSFEFFSPIFNFADASISIGVVLILLHLARQD
mgnify:CR=1 FL=1